MAKMKVRLESGTETTGDGVELQEKRSPATSVSRTAVVSVFANFAVSQAKTFLSASISNYGKFTGDMSGQRDLQNSLSIANDFLAIGGAVATMNPAVIGIAVVSIATNKVIEGVLYNRTVAIDNANMQYIRQRSGNNLIDGSRGTSD